MPVNRMAKKEPIRKVRSVPIRQLSNKSNEGKVERRRDTQDTLAKILFDDVDTNTHNLIERRSGLPKNRARRFDYSKFYPIPPSAP